MANLIKIKGKDYAPVALRVQEFRKDKGDAWRIETMLIHLDETRVIYKAIVLDANGIIIATGHGSSTFGGKAVYTGREPEKAETSAVGRALAFIGYGTDDLLEDDREHLADSPRENTTPPPPNPDGAKYADGETVEATFYRGQARKTRTGEDFIIYTSDDGTISINVFKADGQKFHGLGAGEKLPNQFSGTVIRNGQFWNLHTVTSF